MATEPMDIAAIEDRLAQLESYFDQLHGVVGALASRVAALEGKPIAVASEATALPPVMTATVGLAAEREVPLAMDAGPAPIALVEAESEPTVVMEAGPEERDGDAVVPELTAAPAFDWERLIGGRWALWVGSLAIFLSVAFFLAYAWQFMPPAARAGAGLALGAGLIGAGRVARRYAEGYFGAGLAGAGLGILYLDIWAALHVHQLIGPEAAFAAMGLVCVAGAVLAVVDDEQPLLMVASVGGILTPLVMQATVGGGLPETPLRCYVAILNMGLLAVSVHRRWPPTAWVCLVGTLVLVGSTGHVPANAWEGFGFALVYFVQFAATACLYSLRRNEDAAPHDVTLLVKASLLFPAAGYALIQADLGAWRVAYPLAFAGLFAALAHAGGRLWPANGRFRMASVGLAVTYLTLALPLQLGAGGLAVGWTVEATLLETLGVLMALPRLRWAARGVAVPAFVAIAATLTVPVSLRLPLVSESALPLAFGVLAAGWLVLLHARRAPEIGEAAAMPEPADMAAAFPLGDAVSGLPLAETAAALMSSDDAASTGPERDRSAPAQRAGPPSTGLAIGCLAAGGTLLWLMEAVRYVDWRLLGPWVGGNDVGHVGAVLVALWALALYHLGLRLERPRLRLLALAAIGVAVVALVGGEFGAPVGELSATRPVATFFVVLAMVGCWRSRPGSDRPRDPAETQFGTLMPATFAGLAFWFLGFELHDAVQLGLPGAEASWLAIAWILEATVLEALWIARATPGAGHAARLVAVPAALALFASNVVEASWRLPLASEPALPLVVAVLAASGLVVLKRRRRPAAVPGSALEAGGVAAAAPGTGFPGPKAGFSAIVLVLGGVTLACQEAFRYVDWRLFGSWVGRHDVGHLAASFLAVWALGLFHMGLALDRRFLRVGAVGALALGTVVLVIGGLGADVGELVWTRPVAAIALGGAWLACLRVRPREPRRRFAYEDATFDALPQGLVALGVWLASVEVFEVLSLAWPGKPGELAAFLGVSGVWVGSGVLCLLAGIRGGERNYRLAGLALLGLSCVKVFLWDVSYLTMPFRILSLGGLGGALIGISWLYSRFGVGGARAGAPSE